MRLPLRVLIVALLLCCWSRATFTQTSETDSAAVMRQLLTLPAPTPRPQYATADVEPKKERSAKFFDKANPPADDAPLEDLLEYWRRWSAASGNKPVISEVTKQRLLDVCADDFKELVQFISLFSYEESTAKRIKGLFDKASSEQAVEPWQLDTVKKWLVFNSKFFLNELFALASKVKDDEKTGSVDYPEALIALARVDWQTAESVVNTLANGTQPRSRALALTLLYKQAISAKDNDAEEKYRSRLKTIVSDRTAPTRSRVIAIETLWTTEWSGRDDWYVSLLGDDSLREPQDGYYRFNPLTAPVYSDPDKWIPVLARLVESKDRAVQQAAASCLVIYSTYTPRRDAILPVIRWLSEPDWLELRGGERTRLIQTLAQIEIPESVPGLIWILENEEWNRQWAANTLARYKDPRAIPLLRKALADSKEDGRRLILEGLIASGGLPDSEAVAALEAYVTKGMTAEGREDIDRYRSYRDEPLPAPISIGIYLDTIKEVPESLARAVLARAASLRKSNPAMAESLFAVANRWQVRQIDLEMIERIANGTADMNTIATAVERRTNLLENLRTELQMLLEKSDEALGIGAVLVNDPNLAQSILTSENQPAQIGLLAAARLAQTRLPVELIGKLLPSKNDLLASAAERYLLADDSSDARKLLWQHHPNQAFVTGWRENIPLLGVDNLDALAKTEERLRAELFKEEPPLEIFALFGNSGRYSHILRVYADKAIYTHYEDSARYRERVMTRAELEAFKSGVSYLQDSGPRFSSCHHNCWISEFVALNKTEARRVFGYQAPVSWGELMVKFEGLGRGEGVKIRYDLEKQIKGLEVLHADEGLLAKDVWQRGDEIRIFVERKETEDELKEPYSSRAEDEDEAAINERRRKQKARERARFSWRKLIGNRIGAVVAKPDVYTSFDETNFPDDDGDLVQSGRPQVQMVNRDTIIIARNFEGLWKQVAGRKAVRISDEKGGYAGPIVTPDGKWVVVAKADSDWSVPNYVVRFNLQTEREFRVKLDPAPQFDPVAYVPYQDRVLLRRAQDEYDYSGNRLVVDPPAYYLLNAATGETQLVSGEFAPLLQEGQRSLQPSGKPHEFWAAIPDDEKDRTQVGRYNLKDFSFTPVQTIPQISFDSMSMWVDESRNKLFVVYKGQLLSLPLKTAVDQPR